MIAAGELDRLSFLADDIAKARRTEKGEGSITPKSANTDRTPPNTPVTPSIAGGSGASSGICTPLGRFVPFPPSNTPIMRGGSPSSAQISSGNQNAGKKTGPSRLSEMYTFKNNNNVDDGEVLELESFPEVTEKRLEAVEPRHQLGADCLSGFDFGAHVAEGLNLKNTAKCDDGDEGYLGDASESPPEKEGETQAIQCREDSWAPEDGKPADSEYLLSPSSQRREFSGG